MKTLRIPIPDYPNLTCVIEDHGKIVEIATNFNQQYPDGEVVADKGNDDPFIAAIDGLESLILAHYSAGVKVDSPEYAKGIAVALDALSNEYGD
jgi:hypothetical protein